jgi:hypothetical protein
MTKIRTKQHFHQKYIFISEFIEHMGVFQHHNNILMGSHHDPVTLRIVYGAGNFQSLRQRVCNGVWHCKIRRLLPFYGH